MPEYRVLDLRRRPLPPAPDLREGRGLLLLGGETLFGWARTRERPHLWKELAGCARTSGLAIGCRFPRETRRVGQALAGTGLEVEVRDHAPDGRIPPLYLDAGARPALLALHLAYEWETGAAAARGGVALLRVAHLLACGPATAGETACALGITAGAARSYLRWMEDAALVRREGRKMALRHPLLSTLFTGTVAAPRAPSPVPVWNPVELD
ncbi:MAG: helix-turn-helix domain-containing protein [Acidobacteriota bacterium]